MKRAIVYLHGFNSASLDSHGKLLTAKEKLAVLQAFCTERGVLLYAPNLDYRDFQGLIEDLLFEWNQLLDQGYDVVFMGSSMGGFSSEYLAYKTGARAIMINPAVKPSAVLPQFIGVTANFETGAPTTGSKATATNMPNSSKNWLEAGKTGFDAATGPRRRAAGLGRHPRFVPSQSPRRLLPRRLARLRTHARGLAVG